MQGRLHGPTHRTIPNRTQKTTKKDQKIRTKNRTILPTIKRQKMATMATGKPPNTSTRPTTTPRKRQQLRQE